MASRAISVLDAPSNLGLRMPAPGVVPGCYKLAGALRDHRLLDRIHAADAGYVVPPRYDVSAWRQGEGVFNAEEVATFTRRLAERVGRLVDDGAFPVVLGGDCSILLGPVLALRRRGRFGVAYIDGHADFRHPGNSTQVGASAGEGVALITGRGQADLTDLDGLRPYVADGAVVILGPREDDVFLDELTAIGIPYSTPSRIVTHGPPVTAADTVERLASLDGYWVHLDVDVLDESEMPAVDSPSPGGLSHGDLVELLRPLLAADRCMGLDVTIFDPDLDPDGTLAAQLTDTLVAAIAAEAIPPR